MMIDMDVLLGRWPFMPLKYDTVDGVLELMDRADIERGVVTSLNSVFYYDCEIGNREVGQACRQHPDRFIPFIVLNPNLMLWKQHLQECLENYNVKGIKLHPDYHKYSLLEEKTAAIMEEARKVHLPVYIQTSLVDMRHHPGYCLVPEVPISEVAQAIERYAQNTFIIGGAQHFRARASELIRTTKRDDFYIVIDGLGGPFDGLGGFVDRIGSSRLLFGTRTPILYAEAARMVVEQSPISKEDQDRIFGTNAAQLLGLAN
ncbi:MAG: hypothetical protein E4H27_05080 [Anaerolineales bacterium]|nr:MAG: hypothetical protein E4H27_05080 [Anaerolineales bacterium]